MQKMFLPLYEVLQSCYSLIIVEINVVWSEAEHMSCDEMSGRPSVVQAGRLHHLARTGYKHLKTDLAVTHDCRVQPMDFSR